VEVHELLGMNPAIWVYKYGLLDENVNILQVRHIEENRTSACYRRFAELVRVWRGGGDVDLHPAKD
jgi:hypothetical protein